MLSLYESHAFSKDSMNPNICSFLYGVYSSILQLTAGYVVAFNKSFNRILKEANIKFNNKLTINLWFRNANLFQWNNIFNIFIKFV